MFLPKFYKSDIKVEDKRKPVSQAAYRIKEVERLLKEGKTQKEIADELGIPKGSVASIARGVKRV